MPDSLVLHRAWAVDLPPRTLYEILRLRQEVFVVEQRCPYSDMDGRDLEPRTRYHWLAVPFDASPEVLGCVRLLKEPDGGYRIGRLCTAAPLRGRGLGRRLMDAVLAEVGDGACVLDAQQHATGFYAGYGFEPSGEARDLDGVPHIQMRRPARLLATHGAGARPRR